MSAVENRGGEALDLALVGVGILAQWPVKLVVLRRETFHVAGLVEPGQEHFAFGAAVFAIDAKAFLEIAARGDDQLQVAGCAVAELDVDQPAVSPEFLAQPRADAGNLPPKQAGG